MVKQVKIVADYEGQRLDNYLFTQFKGVPKSLLYRLIRQGKLRVNNKRTEASYRLQAEDILKIPTLNVGEKPEMPQPNKKLVQQLSECILYEDDNLLILNKPVGLPVHGGSGVSFGLIEVVRYMRPQNKSLELAHRLDRDTSGCLVIAKKRSILKELHEMLRANKVEKIYVALTLGHWPKKNNRVEMKLEKNILKSGERQVRVSDKGKLSITEFQCIKDFPTATLVKVKLHTGRTHQIRVHTQAVGHPIAGDKKYGDRAFNRIMQQKGLHRLFLHAQQISFQLSTYDHPISVEAPLDKELVTVLNTI